MAVESSLLAALAQQARDHGVARAPLELVHVLGRRAVLALALRPDLDGAAAADNRVGREDVHDVVVVVHLALDLPSADVQIASLASVLDEHELAIRADLLDADWAYYNFCCFCFCFGLVNNRCNFVINLLLLLLLQSMMMC